MNLPPYQCITQDIKSQTSISLSLLFKRRLSFGSLRERLQSDSSDASGRVHAHSRSRYELVSMICLIGRIVERNRHGSSESSDRDLELDMSGGVNRMAGS